MIELRKHTIYIKLELNETSEYDGTEISVFGFFYDVFCICCKMFNLSALKATHTFLVESRYCDVVDHAIAHVSNAKRSGNQLKGVKQAAVTIIMQTQIHDYAFKMPSKNVRC